MWPRDTKERGMLWRKQDSRDFENLQMNTQLPLMLTWLLGHIWRSTGYKHGNKYTTFYPIIRQG